MEFLVLLSSSSIHLVVSDSLWSHGLYSPRTSLGQNTGVDSLSLLQGIFSTQGLIPGLPHCRWILYQLSHKESPRKLEWVAHPFSSGSSWPRNQTGVSCIAGRFFTSWATRETQYKECPTTNAISQVEEELSHWSSTFLWFIWVIFFPPIWNPLLYTADICLVFPLDTLSYGKKEKKNVSSPLFE